MRRVLIAALFLAAPLSATPTKLVVHVLARDAKLVGTHVGGATVIVKDADSGRVLARGKQEGETGDTAKIMKDAHARGAVLYDSPNAAAFTTTLDLSAPTRVEIIAEGPLKYPQATQRTTTTMELIPGKDVTGDGVVLELHGLVIDLLEPSTPSVKRGTLAVKMKVTMMCGCPIEPDGMWDANTMDIQVRLRDGKKVVKETAAAYAGTSSTFTATFDGVAPGRNYTLEILASAPGSANFGHFTKHLHVEK